MPSTKDTQPLLDSNSERTVYGATDVQDDEPPKPVEPEKQNKQFKEIWALCLGLWTA
jgi:hypothetical protein